MILVNHDKRIRVPTAIRDDELALPQTVRAKFLGLFVGHPGGPFMDSTPHRTQNPASNPPYNSFHDSHCIGRNHGCMVRETQGTETGTCGPNSTTGGIVRVYQRVLSRFGINGGRVLEVRNLLLVPCQNRFRIRLEHWETRAMRRQGHQPQAHQSSQGPHHLTTRRTREHL